MSDSAKTARPARSQALDDLIMGTNNSSIVSKRSVERLYYANEPHYFRYFIKKPQRRAPLINRGYWLRLKAIDVVVRDFLARPSSNKKVVVNLGCGYDVLPWQCHVRYPESCENALFVDVDYPDLMLRKRAMVMAIPKLCELFGSDIVSSKSDKEKVLLKSQKYCQLACDLRELQVFRETLESLVSLDNADVLFVAEVSVTYMDTHSADSLIEWASGIGKAEFCLLEQILPNGPNHPFAKTMLKHFEKLNTPLKSVKQYPTIKSQVNRFNSRGWKHIDIWDLWEAWEGSDFLTPAERIALDDIEPFDEWEELMLFGRHYFVMHAWASTPETPRTATKRGEREEGHVHPELKIKVNPQSASKAVKRRFGNATMLSSPEGNQYAAHILGLDRDSRSDTYDLFSLSTSTESPCKLPLSGPTPRMCSTLTDLGDYGVLLAGGRGSPAKPLTDCWVLSKGANVSWRRSWDLPTPLFRHSAVRLSGSSLVLVVGGRTGPSEISNAAFVFHPQKGWLNCELSGAIPSVFGASICNSSNSESNLRGFQGLMFGGMHQDGTMNVKKYWWKLSMSASQAQLSLSETTIEGPGDDLLSVFGAETVSVDSKTVVVCGGVGQDPSHQGQHLTTVSVHDGKCGIIAKTSPLLEQEEQPWPFMIGSSVLLAGNKQLTVLGGGATCFSMGTYWEPMPYQIDLRDHQLGVDTPCLYLESPKIINKAHEEEAEVVNSTTKQATFTSVQRVKLTDAKSFETYLKDGKPVIIEGLNMGPCIEKWNAEYIVAAAGADKEIIVHEASKDSPNMDFNSKNFNYITTTFSDLFSRIQDGGRLYLRSLSHIKPSETPANIEHDFPELAKDFNLPQELNFVKDRLHSSVLRIGGNVNMWLHYDVMANIYSQIHGSKRLLLFPPSDVSHLSFPPGSSSSSLSPLTATPLPSQTHPHEAILHPGDALLLPSCWPHAAEPFQTQQQQQQEEEVNLSVAVNIFFRDLTDSNSSLYASGRDVYGNRDLAAYEKGRADVSRMVKGFEGAGKDRAGFYLRRLGDELLAAVRIQS